MTARRSTWDAALEASAATLKARQRRIDRDRALGILSWHLAAWLLMTVLVALTALLQHRPGAPALVAALAVFVAAWTAAGWWAVHKQLPGRLVATVLLWGDGLMLTAAAALLIPHVPVALGVALLPVVAVAVVGGGSSALSLAIAENILVLGVFMLGGLSVWTGPQATMMVALDVVAFAALSVGAALLACLGARVGFGSVDAIQAEVRAHTRHLAATNSALAARNHALEMCNAALGHDLRSPLTAVRLAIEEACDLAADPEAVDAAEDALEAVDRLEGMVCELLEVARKGGDVGSLKHVGLDMVVVHALKSLRARIEGAGVMVEVGGELPMVVGNPALLAQVVQNLVENAIKYGNQPSPRVRIAGGRVGERVFVEVEDDGPGVPEADRERIFQPFQQLATGRDGVGAGLALVDRLVAAHGGRIDVEDGRKLGGALFRVNLPAVAEQEPESELEQAVATG